MGCCAKTVLVVFVALVAFIVLWAIPTLRSLGAFKTLELKGHSNCKVRTDMPNGPEDVEIVPGVTGSDGLPAVLVSSDTRNWYAGEGSMRDRLRLQEAQGEIHLLSPQDDPPVPLTIVGYDTEKGFHPHGIATTTRQSDGTPLVYVVNHRGDGDVVSVFEVDVSAKQLTFVQDVSDPLFKNLNDLAPNGDEGFWVTNWLLQDWQTPMWYLETYGRMPWNYVVYCSLKDGGCRKELTDLRMPNGIVTSSDGSTVYIALCTDLSIAVADHVGDGKLKFKRKLLTDSLCDNLSLSPDGALLAGCHPQGLKFEAHQHDHSVPSPSEVVYASAEDLAAAKHESNPFKTLYVDDGNHMSASTVGCPVGGSRIMVGGVFRPALMVCEVDELKNSFPSTTTTTTTTTEDVEQEKDDDTLHAEL